MSMLSKAFGVLAVSAISIPSLAAADPLFPDRNLDFLEDRYGRTLGNARTPGCVAPATHGYKGALVYDLSGNLSVAIEKKDRVGIQLSFQNNKGRQTCDTSRLHGEISSGLKKARAFLR